MPLAEAAARRERASGAVRGLYPLVGDHGLTVRELVPAALLLADLGVRVMQIRIKTLGDHSTLSLQRAIVDALVEVKWDGLLFINDRADLAALVAAHAASSGAAFGVGVHVGRTDLAPAQVRAIVGPAVVIGTSTHDLAQLDLALADPEVDVVALGPIYATTSKQNAHPVVGLTGLVAAHDAVQRAARPVPIVAIGGLTYARVIDVRNAGASAGAVIGDLVADGLAGLPARAARLMEAWG